MMSRSLEVESISKQSFGCQYIAFWSPREFGSTRHFSHCISGFVVVLFDHHADDADVSNDLYEVLYLRPSLPQDLLPSLPF
jgi:hypothetical protein